MSILVATGTCLQVQEDRSLASCLERCIKKYGDCPHGTRNCTAGLDCLEYCELEKQKKACDICTDPGSIGNKWAILQGSPLM
ncbi:hypothetical protein CRM22_002741 [Opisthorchis felineus]|uniref:Uncharacterized protein n=1 Tax=Opisthorchis felineus TaxID=147828 RepID=A0A4S2MAU8_OPIFE|nr:hypothetical protein CRM22_002741 [Opisthorchis felineus]